MTSPRIFLRISKEAVTRALPSSLHVNTRCSPRLNAARLGQPDTIESRLRALFVKQLARHANNMANTPATFATQQR